MSQNKLRKRYKLNNILNKSYLFCLVFCLVTFVIYLPIYLDIKGVLIIYIILGCVILWNKIVEKILKNYNFTNNSDNYLPLDVFVYQEYNNINLVMVYDYRKLPPYRTHTYYFIKKELINITNYDLIYLLRSNGCDSFESYIANNTEYKTYVRKMKLKTIV